MFNIRETLIKHSENIFLILFVGILLWMSIGSIFQYKLMHSRPFGFGASDSYTWLAYAQGIYDSGSFKYTPPFLNLNIEGLSSPEPPLFLQFTAFLAYALGIPVYDAQTLFGSLLIIFNILVFFVIIRDYNPFLAYLSLPLCIFSFTFPFIQGLLFGFLPTLFGFLFLFANLFMLFHLDIKYSCIILGIFISAMVMGHTFRVFELTFFSGTFIILAFLFKKINLNYIKKLFISSFLAFITSFYYLTIFKQRFDEQGEFFQFNPFDTVKYLRITLSDFGFVEYVVLVGLILCLYSLIKGKKNIKNMAFAFPIISFLLVYFLRVDRVYQLTFVWPIFLSLAFGLVLFLFLQLKWFSRINKKNSAYCIISLTISLVLVYQYYYPFRAPVLERISETDLAPGIYSDEQWDNLMWISKYTEPTSKILYYFQDEFEDDVTHFFIAKRVSFYIHFSDVYSAMEPGIIKKNYKVVDNSVKFFYKRDPELPFKIITLDKNLYIKNMSICDFDYIYIKKQARARQHDNETRLNEKIEKINNYNAELFNPLFKNDYIRVVHQNNYAYIIKNNKPGGNCL